MTGIGTGPLRRREAALRAAGLRPVRIWLPDTRAEDFTAECARQARLIRKTEAPVNGDEDEAWFETSDKAGWTA